MDEPVESNVQGLPEAVNPSGTVITGKITCDRGCKAKFRPVPSKTYIGELHQSDKTRLPFFTTKCRDCRAIILWVEKDFPQASAELLRHDQQTHGGN